MKFNSNKLIPFFVGAVTLAGCGNQEDTGPSDLVSSGYASVDLSGEISEKSLDSRYDGTYDCESGIGCAALALGTTGEDTPYRIVSGFQESAGFERTPMASVKTTYDTTYNYSTISASKDSVFPSKTFATYEGPYYNLVPLKMVFDPSTDKLSGKDDTFKFDAVVDGHDFSGYFESDEIDNRGEFEGKLNEKGLIGAFHGDDKSSAVGGYMIGKAN